MAKVVIANDSLYFFTDNELIEIFHTIKANLTDDGIIMINHPISEAFKGIHDISVGIKRRKSKRELESLISSCGYKIIASQRWPFLLSSFIFLVRTYQRLKLRITKNVKITSDVSLPNPLINKLFYYITKFETIINYQPYGSSLFIIAKKNDT